MAATVAANVEGLQPKMTGTREQKLVRCAKRHIEDARFLVHHQSPHLAKRRAWQAINELEIALLPRPPISARDALRLDARYRDRLYASLTDRFS